MRRKSIGFLFSSALFIAFQFFYSFGVCMFAPILSSICMLPFVNSEFVTNKRFFLLNARFFHSFTFFLWFFVIFPRGSVCSVIFDSLTNPFNAMYTVIIFPFDFFLCIRSIPNSQFSLDVYIINVEGMLLIAVISKNSIWNFLSWTLFFRVLCMCVCNVHR